MSGQSLDYTITNQKEYQIFQGNIDSICQKNSPGFQILLKEGNTKVSIQIKLKKRSVVSYIQVQPLYTKRISFELIGDKNLVHQTVVHDFKIEQATLIQAKDSFERKKETVRIRVQLENPNNENVVVGLVYLLVRGEKCREEIKNRSISKAVAEKDFFDPQLAPHYRPTLTKARENKDLPIFSERKKKKEPSLPAQNSFQTQDQQLQRAIELSKKEVQKSSKEKEKKREIKAEEGRIDQFSEKNQPKSREYTRIDYQKCKDIFKYVNTEWLEAQKRAENQKGVEQSEKLSNMIVVRVFHNKTICLDIADKAKKAQLQKLCLDMGAKVADTPENYCILIANRGDTEKVAKARKLKGVKILRSQFVEECRQCQAYLDQKDYYLKL